MIEHAVIEVATEKKGHALKHLVTGRGPLAGAFCDVVNQFQVLVDDRPFMILTNPKA